MNNSKILDEIIFRFNILVIYYLNLLIFVFDKLFVERVSFKVKYSYIN
jgi:hypothetical protein